MPANTTITLHNTTIKPTTHVKNLGVHFDTYTTCEIHINEISKKVTGTLMYINRVKNCFYKSTRILVVQSLVLNLLNYYNTVWGTTNITLIDAVQKLQDFANKVADGRAKKYDHVTSLFKELEWLCIKESISFNTAVTTYKQVNNFYPQHAVNLTTVTDMTGSRTRQQDQLYIPRTNTQSGGRSF